MTAPIRLLAASAALTLSLTVPAVAAAAPPSTPQQPPSTEGRPAHAGADPSVRDAFSQEAVAIFALLNRQASDWNRGDLDAFATGYKNSPDILFMGPTIQHGYKEMLDRYKAHYPTAAAMGQLSFTQLAVQALDARFATATGRFHLERTPDGGGPADGYFLLVLENTPAGWKIVRDDTSPLAAHP